MWVLYFVAITVTSAVAYGIGSARQKLRSYRDGVIDTKREISEKIDAILCDENDDAESFDDLFRLCEKMNEDVYRLENQKR